MLDDWAERGNVCEPAWEIVGFLTGHSESFGNVTITWETVDSSTGAWENVKLGLWGWRTVSWMDMGLVD